MRSVARSKVTHLLSEATDPMPRFNRSACASQTTRLIKATRPLGRIGLSDASTAFAANASTAITPHTVVAAHQLPLNLRTCGSDASD